MCQFSVLPLAESRVKVKPVLNLDLSLPMALADVHSKVVVLMLWRHCLMVLLITVFFVFDSCLQVQCFVSY